MNPDICVSMCPHGPGLSRAPSFVRMPHSSLLVINADGPETRVALVQDGYLGELYIERKRERGIAGNIYKGRVERVLPGMQAAFVNIGLEKSAYLHVSDVRGTPDDLKRLLAGEASRAATDEDEDADDAARAGGGARIEDLLKEGQEVIVQVTKEPISTKGARTTRYISLPGRHLVFMPTVDHIGISRRIASDKERRRLRDIVESMRPAGLGLHRSHGRGERLRARAQERHGVPDQALERGRPARGGRALPVADLQRPRPAAADGARPVHRRRREADHRFALRVRPDEEVHRGVHARLRRAHRALRRQRPDLRRLRHRDRDRPRAGAQGLAEVGRLSDRRRDGGADRGRRQHRALRRQEEPGRHDHQDQHGGGAGGRGAAPHPVHRRHDRRRLHRHGPARTTGRRSRARSTSTCARTGRRRRSRASPSWASSR